MAVHRHRRARTHYGRVAVGGVSATVTAVALLGGLGVLPSAASRPDAPSAASPGVPASSALLQAAYTAPDPPRETASPPPTSVGPPPASVAASSTAPLPADSGTGRRIVFSQGQQRVWLVSGGQRVKRSYTVSGSRFDNLDPGTYEVYSRSKQAWGIDDSGTMRYFVRFTRGRRAAIGFHDIPIDDGRPVQSIAQLGTPLSHGCIRQRSGDARVLWRFAPVGTTVVVTAA